MRLNSLTLENYRNYNRLELSFDPSENLTCIVGENAQGKTNILEAIYLLAITRSFRTNERQDVIQWGKEYARVCGVFYEQNKSTNNIDSERPPLNLEVFLGRPPQPEKVLKKNGLKISAESFFGTCQIVFFHPENINMLYLGPDLRRHFIDILNIQVNKKYYHILQNYRRILKQRNTLLKAVKERNASPDSVHVWDEQIVEYGSIIIMERVKIANYINEHLQAYYQKITGGNGHVYVQYLSSIAAPERKHGDIQPIQAPVADFIDFESCKNTYREAIKAAYDRDMRMRYTTVGPHRDDVIFSMNERKLACHASRGEYRSLLLALKLLELQFFMEKTGKKPILLLDDVFSELDMNRQKMLFEAVADYQTIMTTTHADHLPNYTLARAHAGLNKDKYKERYFEIKNGHIENTTFSGSLTQ